MAAVRLAQYDNDHICDASLDFHKMWQSFKEKIGTDNAEHLTRTTACRIRFYLDHDELDPEEAVREMLSFVGLDDCLSLDYSGVKFTRLLLLEALDICASYEVKDRILTRTILARLYSYNSRIDREVISCEFNQPKQSDGQLPTVLRRKLRYILENVSGWRVNSIADDFYLSSRTEFYLELPLTCRDGSEEDSFVITDAFNRRSDPDYVLLLLRHGMLASCVHLWPIVMSFDLRLTLASSELLIPETAVGSWREMRILQYFCRSRANFMVHIVLGEGENRPLLKARYEDTLVVSPSVQPYIPADRYKHPASLQHLCRLAVRSSLIEADNLPRGIPELTLPRGLREYVDLMTD